MYQIIALSLSRTYLKMILSLALVYTTKRMKGVFKVQDTEL